MVNPPKRRKSRKRRTAKQKAATRKMVAARKRSLAGKRSTRKRRRVKRSATPQRRVTMARRRGRKRATTSRRRRRSTAKRRSPVTVLRRRSVYVTNPRRKRGRRRFRRNPALFKTVQQGAMDAGATLAGGAVARMATGLLPLPKDGIMGAATGLAIAVGVGYAARQFVSADTARFITAGAMQVPIKQIITTFVPGAGAFLGDYDSVGAYALPPGNDVGDYLNSGGMAGITPEEDYVEIGAYQQ